jgi:hypothetical protein
MEFKLIQVFHVKLIRFTLAHAILVIIKISEPFMLITYVTLLLRCI